MKLQITARRSSSIRVSRVDSSTKKMLCHWTASNEKASLADLPAKAPTPDEPDETEKNPPLEIPGLKENLSRLASGDSRAKGMTTRPLSSRSVGWPSVGRRADFERASPAADGSAGRPVRGVLQPAAAAARPISIAAPARVVRKEVTLGVVTCMAADDTTVTR